MKRIFTAVFFLIVLSGCGKKDTVYDPLNMGIPYKRAYIEAEIIRKHEGETEVVKAEIEYENGDYRVKGSEIHDFMIKDGKIYLINKNNRMVFMYDSINEKTAGFIQDIFIHMGMSAGKKAEKGRDEMYGKYRCNTRSYDILKRKKDFYIKTKVTELRDKKTDMLVNIRTVIHAAEVMNKGKKAITPRIKEEYRMIKIKRRFFPRKDLFDIPADMKIINMTKAYRREMKKRGIGGIKENEMKVEIKP
ncbi:MAG: hypothetical protein ACLFP1_00730 [Candidatus Goldiibacteriota bacterium]